MQTQTTDQHEHVAHVGLRTNATEPAIVESLDHNGITNSGQTENKIFSASPRNDFQHSPARKLKERISFSHLLALDRRKLKKSGKLLCCCCPFHNDRTPSFFIYADDTGGKCFGCDWKGDIFDYEMQVRKLDFVGALKSLEDKASRIARTTPFVPGQRANPVAEVALTDTQKEIMVMAAQNLSGDERLVALIAKERSWRPETILKLAKEGSLGWHAGNLAFNYEHGMKLREWPGRKFFWEFGHQGLWRVARIATADDIYISEGESDAISLVDAGIDERPGCAVICCPGVSAFQKAWAPLFKGKNVTLCFDNDEAGRKGVLNVAAMLQGHAAKVCSLNIGEGNND